jgi:hypothetical protein
VESVENITNIEEERVEEVEEEDRHSESNLENEAGIEDGVTAEEVTQDQETSGPTTRRSARIAAGVNPPERFIHTSFVDKTRWKEETAKEAIRAEVKQLFKDLSALRPVHAESIIAGACVLTCHMFLVEKFLANGKFDKMKARLVSHGNQQDREQFPDRSSPTVAVHSVMMVLALFAGNLDNHMVCNVDVKGAFVQTPMEGESIYLRIGKDIVKHIIEEFPTYQEYVTDEGSMFIEMLKAMYGCVQASLLWYKLLTQVLCGIRFTISEVDRCVLWLVVGNIVNIILIYVDDILVFATRDVVDLVIKTLRDRFTWLTVEREEQSFSYLGMQLIWSADRLVVDMTYYLQQILEGVQGLQQRSVPGGKDTFQVNTGEVVGKEQAGWYHTVTAKLLYLAKRARPDILTVVSFLCTRVTGPTIEDVKKLYNLLGYLHATKEKVLVLKKRKDTQLEMYVDAAFGLHEKG